MQGEKNLKILLENISPKLLEGEYVFCTVKDGVYGDYADALPLASILEDEGLTLILLKEAAVKCGLSYDSIFRCITLAVHSSLDAVGLTSAVSRKLFDYKISANIVAGFYHDHIFVPAEKAEKALKVLGEF